jgi:lipopolysaccharide/colanic/teichoic acid biosynthesis glycosyltransferase
VIKRCFDITVSGLGLLLLSPLFLIVALLVRLDSPGPVLFRQRRLGKGARIFTIYKFRTMVAGDERRGAAITVNRDARITRIGRILRRYDLDELPSLINVLKGDMSVVGPRPEVPNFLSCYSEAQRDVFAVRPGLTDPATLSFRKESALLVGKDAEQRYQREILPRKLALNLEYVHRHSLYRDLQIVARTLAVILSQPKG